VAKVRADAGDNCVVIDPMSNKATMGDGLR